MKQRATAASLRGKLGAETKRFNEERQFGLKMMREADEAKQHMNRTVNIAVVAVKALQMVSGDEVLYFLQKHLETELVKLHPALAKTRLPSESR